MGSSIYAQPPPGHYGRGDNPYYAYGREPLDRVRADLGRAARNMTYLSEGELRRFDRVRDRITEFQRRWEYGRFDREEMDGIIAGLTSVIERNRLRPHDRELLMDDLGQLRRLRDRNERGHSYR